LIIADPEIDGSVVLPLVVGAWPALIACAIKRKPIGDVGDIIILLIGWHTCEGGCNNSKGKKEPEIWLREKLGPRRANKSYMRLSPISIGRASLRRRGGGKACGYRPLRQTIINYLYAIAL
jgi:hypothetical protein